MNVPIWGWSEPYAEVSVAFSENIQKTKANDKGEWRIELPPMKASTLGQDLKVSSNGKSVVVTNILIGEVWLASGQSNMEWPLYKTVDQASLLPEVDRSMIRLITVEKSVSQQRKDDVKGKWVVLGDEKSPRVSATASFFAMNLVKELNIPVGILSSSWGGICIEPFIPKEAFKDVWGEDEGVELEVTAPRLNELAKKPWDMKVPGVAFNAMIAPFGGCAMRGVIWYQGESNVGDVHYEDKMKSLILSWRDNWGGKDLSFYFVQLASYRRYKGLDLPKMWEAQSNVAKSVPKTGLAVLIDNEMVKTIHPKIKPQTGRRLALWALAKDYGKDIVYSGPVYKSMTVDGNEANIEFSHIGEGLIAKSKDGKLHDFEIAGEDRKYVLAEARIEDGKVIVSSYQIDKPVAVRYAWTYPSVTGTLFNKEGLPASSFRTDGWSIPCVKKHKK
jgi:sialate O-acetylesterase